MRTRGRLLLVAPLFVLAGCGGDKPDGDATPSPTPASATSASSDAADASLSMSCIGEGSPTIVLNAGLDTSGDVFDSMAVELSSTTRVCMYDRAGIGGSPALGDDEPDPTAGSAATALHETLAEEGIEPPYVAIGWSYGGVVTQAFASAYPDDVAGVLLEDSSVPAEFTEPFFGDIEWVEGGRQVDTAASSEELHGLDLGDTPLVVLTTGEATGEFRRIWYGYHRDLAKVSTDALHVIALGAGHEIHADSEALEVALAEELVTAVRDGQRLAACDRRFARAGGRCA
jgi:pimeloyl-ACP methyl ester carboxylesterase